MHEEPHAPQLEAFFEQHVQPKLGSLRVFRLRAWLALTLFLFVLGLIIIAANATEWLPTGVWVVLGVVAFIGLGFLAALAYTQFLGAYKAIVVGPLMKNLDSGAVYEPDSKIAEKRIRAACFFPEWTSCDSEDLVRGQASGAPFEFANIHLKKGSGKKVTTLFHGFFFQTSDSRPRRAATVVVPSGWTPGFPGAEEPPKIRVDGERIRDRFDVFSTDPEEGAQTASPQLMSALVNLSESLDADVFASFTPGQISVAAKVGDFFEPRMGGALVSRNDVARIATLFSTARRLGSELGVEGGGHFAHAFLTAGREDDEEDEDEDDDEDEDEDVEEDEPVRAHAPAATFSMPLVDAPSLQPLVERLRAHGIGVSLLGQSSLTLDYGTAGRMWLSLGVSALWTLLGLAVHDRATEWPAGGTLAQPLVDLLPISDVALTWLAGFHPWTSWALLALAPLGLFNAQRRFVRRVVLTPQAVERVGGLLPGARTRPLQPGGTVTVRDRIVFVKSSGPLGVAVSPPLKTDIVQDLGKLVAGFRGTSGP